MRILRLLPVMVVMALGAAAGVTVYRVHEETQTVSDTQKLARTLGVIRTSTPSDRKVLRVLFYGQSITKSGWTPLVEEHWRTRYPNTVFVVKNLAIGGFPAQDLERTAERDIAAFYPDLIVFHVYGDDRAYERIIRMFRERTTADIVVQTDHGNVMPEVPCREGLALRRAAGCAGVLWVHQAGAWEDTMSYHRIPALARRYGLAVEPQRAWWRDYLVLTGIDPHALLQDSVHPNERGKKLMAALFEQYFDGLVDGWNGQTEGGVTSLPVSSTITFDGTRLELVSDHALARAPVVTVDGTPALELDGCWVASRATGMETGRDWPAVRRIELGHDHTAEEFTATLTQFSADEMDFDFSVKGSVSGEQGSGRGSRDFVAPVGVKIAAKDWMVQRAFRETHVAQPDPYVVRWSVAPVCGVEPEVAGGEYRYVLAAGLPAGEHMVSVAGELSGRFLVYRPVGLGR